MYKKDKSRAQYWWYWGPLRNRGIILVFTPSTALVSSNPLKDHWCLQNFGTKERRGDFHCGGAW